MCVEKLEQLPRMKAKPAFETKLTSNFKKKKKESREDGNSFFASLLAFEKQFLGEFDLGMEIEKEEWTS